MSGATQPAAAVPAVQGHAAASTGLPRLLPPPGEPGTDLTAHLARFGPPPYRGGRGLLMQTLKSAALTGRGGAAFPTWRKFAAVADAARGRPVVVGNGAEGEPASRKDKALMWFSPHLVLDGLQLAAEAVGATGCCLYAHRDARLLQRLRTALDERIGANLDRVPVRLVDAPERFLAGEESAVASRVAGGPALLRFKPPPVYERGVHDQPTLVQNVETLAHVALIGRYGADWFRAVGTLAEPGSMLVTCQRADGTAEVVEAAIGTPIGSLLGLEHQAAQAVLIGGYHGAWVPRDVATSLRLANADLRPAGATVGAGILAAMPSDRCGLLESARVARYLALESAGQCGPCLNGLPRIASALAELAEPRPRPRALADLHRWAGLMQGRGACHHPDGSVRFIGSALAVFADELTRHQRGRCTGVDAGSFLPIPPAVPGRRRDWK